MTNTGRTILTERDLESLIYTTPKDQLREMGLHVSGYLKRQLHLGKYGVADLVSLKRTGSHEFDHVHHYETGEVKFEYKPLLEINVYELKFGKVDVWTFLQAVRYAKGIQEHLSVDARFKITLIGDSVCDSSLCYLPEIIGPSEDLNQSILSFIIYQEDEGKVSFKNILI